MTMLSRWQVRSRIVPFAKLHKLTSPSFIAEFGTFNIVFFLLAGTILTAFLLEVLGISYVVAVANQDLQITTKEQGILTAVGFVGVIVSSHLWGFLADTYGRRRVIVPTLFITFVISTISSFTTSFWTITFLRFLAGFLYVAKRTPVRR